MGCFTEITKSLRISSVTEHELACSYYENHGSILGAWRALRKDGYNLGRESFRKLLREQGIELSRTRQFTQRIKEEILERRARGQSHKQVALEMGLSRTHVSVILFRDRQARKLLEGNSSNESKKENPRP
jgi:hypothetical protein